MSDGTICERDGHQFKLARSGYYKEAGKGGYNLTTYDQTVSYAMLYCERCGVSKEVIAQNHRPLVERNAFMVPDLVDAFFCAPDTPAIPRANVELVVKAILPYINGRMRGTA